MIDAAKKEGQVVWYTTQIIDQFARPAAAAFEKKYGIKVSYVRANSNEVALRVLNEAKAGRMQADVFDGTGATASLKKEGIVAKCIPENAKRFPKEYIDARRLLGRDQSLCADARLQHRADQEGHGAEDLSGSARPEIQGQDRVEFHVVLLRRTGLRRHRAGHDGRGKGHGLFARTRQAATLRGSRSRRGKCSTR